MGRSFTDFKKWCGKNSLSDSDLADPCLVFWKNSLEELPPEGELVLVSWAPDEFESDTCIDGRWQQYDTLVNEPPCFWRSIKTLNADRYKELRLS